MPRAIDPIALLRRACESAGSQRQWAIEHRISPAYVTDVLTRRREPAGKLLDALGLVRTVIYQRKPRG